MNKIQPGRIITDFVNKAFIMVDFPKSNNPRSQQLLSDLYIATAMASMGNARKNTITTDLKDTYSDKLQAMDKGIVTILEVVKPFTLTAKVDKPRNSFDLDTFIKQIAEDYNISITDLVALSKQTTKQSAAPVTFSVTVDKAL